MEIIDAIEEPWAGPDGWWQHAIGPDDLFVDPGPQPELFEGLFPAFCPILLAGEGGIGKTALIFIMAICAITKRPLFGKFPVGQEAIGSEEDGIIRKHGRVFLFLAENSLFSTLRLFTRIRKAMELTPEEEDLLRAYLRLVPLAGQYAKLTTRDPATRELRVAPDVQSLISELKFRDPGPITFMAFDPGLRFHSGSENSNEDGDVLVQALNQVSSDLSTTVFLIVHTNKDSRSNKGDIESKKAFRGASSIHDGVRCAALLASLSDEKVKSWGIEKAVRDTWMELIQVKNNLTEKVPTVTLRRLPGSGYLEIGQKGRPRAEEKAKHLIDQVIEKISEEYRRGRTHSKNAFVTRFAGTEGPFKVGKHAVDQAVKAALEGGELLLEEKKLTPPNRPKVSQVPTLPSWETQSGRETESP